MILETNREIRDFYEVDRRTVQRWLANGIPHTRKIVSGVSVPIVDTKLADDWVLQHGGVSAMRSILERRKQNG
jgi:hypothetical protein